MFSDPLFYQSLWNTAYLWLAAVPIEFFLGLLLATMINRMGKSKGLYLTLIMIPFVTSPTIAIIPIFRNLFSPYLGVVNYLLGLLGIGTVDWFGNPSVAIPLLALVDIWINTPFVVILMLGGLQTIPQSQYEAAAIDGASTLRILWKITIPYLLPFIGLTLLFRTLFLFRTFETAFLLFGPTGGPGSGGMVIGGYIGYVGFQLWHLGLSSAVSWVVLAITIALALVFFKLIGRNIAL